jgi:hypothetical protein
MAKVEILKVGHALVQGERGEKGGKPSKDSIWGVALVSGILVTFSGRRNAVTLKFKTRPMAAKDEVLGLFEQKLTGADVKGIKYDDVTAEAQEALIPGLVERVGKGYHAAKQGGKLDKRSTTPEEGREGCSARSTGRLSDQATRRNAPRSVSCHLVRVY